MKYKILLTFALLFALSNTLRAQTLWTDDGNYATAFSEMSETSQVINIKSQAELALLSRTSGNNDYAGWTIKLATNLDMSGYN